MDELEAKMVMKKKSSRRDKQKVVEDRDTDEIVEKKNMKQM